MTSLLQTKLWADFKARHGWRTYTVDQQFLLERHLPFGQRLLYAPELSLFLTPPAGKPRGLVEPSPEVEELRSFINHVHLLAKQRQAFFVRLEFLKEWSDEAADRLRHLGLQKAFEEIQPEYRQWIDLTPPKAAILAQMKPKGRYNIRLAEKHGVRVAPESDPAAFLELVAETARRDRFTARATDYYRDLIQTLVEGNAGQLLVARWQNRPLAAAIISYHNYFASYLHGASSSLQRDLMAPSALHWHAIQKAKERGCTIYDFLAVAPPKNPEIRYTPYDIRQQKKFAGLTRFKTQFGGRTVHLSGSWDLVLQPMTYHLFQRAQQFRRR